MISLSSKVIVITGSSRGIGRAIAEACALAGANVIISSRKSEIITQAVVALRAFGLTVNGLAADVTSPEDLSHLMEFAIQTYGRLDVWINNAGISGGYRTLQTISKEEINKIVDTNFTGTLTACRLAIPYFREHGGIILNMSGRGGSGNAAPYQAVYAATKSAVVSLTRSLAAENRCYPISFNCIMPGMVATDMFKDVATCPETEGNLVLLPILLKSFASPMQDVQKLVVKLCAQKPGKYSGRSYSAEKWTRYLRALTVSPEFFRAARQTRRSLKESQSRE